MSGPVVIPAATGQTAALYCGDCLDIIPALPRTVDVVATDTVSYF